MGSGVVLASSIFILVLVVGFEDSEMLFRIFEGEALVTAVAAFVLFAAVNEPLLGEGYESTSFGEVGTLHSTSG